MVVQVTILKNHNQSCLKEQTRLQIYTEFLKHIFELKRKILWHQFFEVIDIVAGQNDSKYSCDIGKSVFQQRSLLQILFSKDPKSIWNSSFIFSHFIEIPLHFRNCSANGQQILGKSWQVLWKSKCFTKGSEKCLANSKQY